RHRSMWSATRANSEAGSVAATKPSSAGLPGQTVSAMIGPSLRSCSRQPGRHVCPPLPLSHRRNGFIIVIHRVLHHGWPLTRVVWHELSGSAEPRRGRTALLDRNVRKPAETGEGG